MREELQTNKKVLTGRGGLSAFIRFTIASILGLSFFSVVAGAATYVNIGPGSGTQWFPSSNQLSANWHIDNNTGSSIVRYYYAIETAPGLRNIANWTNAGTATSMTRTNLFLYKDYRYYVAVYAELANGTKTPVVTSVAARLDATGPGTVGAVRDGTGADVDATASSTQLSANWNAASDGESGIARFWYSIGTTAGGTDVVNWTDNGAATSVTRTGLTLAGGRRYYVSVKAENGAGTQSAAVSSNGQVVQAAVQDTTPPAAVAWVNDGTGNDITWFSVGDRISGNWAISSDPESGVTKYWYAIGTTAGGTDVLNWTDNGAQTSVTRTGLSIVNGRTYYVSVRAENGVGLQSTVTVSNGQRADTTVPAAVSEVRDGSSVDIDETSVGTSLSGNWDMSTDAESGIREYRYAIGTSAGGVDVVGWTSAGLQTSMTQQGLNLISGTRYYISVKAVNNAGQESAVKSSDGILFHMIDVTPPSPVSVVNDGTGADVDTQSSLTEITANWPAASDPESGISRYWYSIGTTAGGTNVVNWTDNGTATSVTRRGLSLVDGTKYYVNVRAENGVQSQSGVTSSDGITVHAATLSYVRIGLGSETQWFSSSNQLSANWYIVNNTGSSVVRYYYAIETGPGLRNIVNWTSAGTSTSMTRSNMYLSKDYRYYVAVYAELANGTKTPVVTSVAARLDETGPGTVGAVRDGTGADVDTTASSTQLSANWNAASDGESGIARYWYSIGTTAGGTDVVNWTDNGAATSVTRTGLTLAGGRRYYVSVKADNGAGAQSAAVSSNGQVVQAAVQDTTPPAVVAWVNDGTGNDIAWFSTGDRISANWAASSDPESGITKYWYAIGTTAGGTNVVNWTDNGAQRSVTRTGLNVTNGQQYFIAVKAENGVGLQSTVKVSNGQRADTTPPAVVGVVRDGSGIDIDEASDMTSLIANWNASSDSESGIVRYWYSIGTTAGGTDVLGWTDNGASTSMTRTGLSLVSGRRYYVNVRAENGAGTQSGVASSDGVVMVVIDTTPPYDVQIVRFGTNIERDQEWTSDTGSLSAIWLDADDPESGIARYWYCIGTTAGGSDVAGWTDNGTQRTCTRAGLLLEHGKTYFITVKAENGAGLQSTPLSSNGILCDLTPPVPVAIVNDGSGADTDWLSSTEIIFGNWSASSDAESGIRRYWFAVGTSSSSADVVEWIDIGLDRSIGISNQHFVNGQKYYFLVRAENRAGLQSAISSSDGAVCETTPPVAIGQVNDGTGADVDTQTDLTRISANWASSSDPESGVSLYRYSIGTSAGGTDVLGWTDNGLQRSFTRTGLALVNGRKYYVNVLAVNGAGLESNITSSDGVTAGNAAVSYVNDGLGEDVQWVSSDSQLSANWNIVNNTSSPIVRYRYSIETGVDYANIAGWTNAGMATSVTRTGLYLAKDYRYYVAVYAELANGQKTATVRSNGVKLDVTGPGSVGTVNDGAGSDIDSTTSKNGISANWTPASDVESGIRGYWYSIGTAPGRTDVKGWTSNGTLTFFDSSDIVLEDGVRYYVNVKAVNNAGQESSVTSSDGVMFEGAVTGTRYMEIRALVVIYSRTSQYTLTPEHINKIREAVRDSQVFYWRNSKMKAYVKTDFIVIDRLLELNQFWQVTPGHYWLTFGSSDGVHSVQQDLRDRGVTNDQYSGVFVYYAWQNTAGVASQYGGASYGVDQGLLGHTGYSSCSVRGNDPTNEPLFLHEFTHLIDSMFDNDFLRARGLPREPLFPSGDQPQLWSNGIFDDDYSFDASMLGDFPGDKWLNMQEPWGRVRTFADRDSDGVPDSGDLPITEQSMGSSSSLKDTDGDGLDDLSEASAYFFSGSNPVINDTDGDGIPDDRDPYPVDPNQYVYQRSSVTVDGVISPGEWQGFISYSSSTGMDMGEKVALASDGQYLYLAAKITDEYTYTNFGSPEMNDGIKVEIDAAQDGYRWHGRDNYQIFVSPGGDRFSPQIKAGIFYSTPDSASNYDQSLIPASDIRAAYTKTADGYIIELAVKANPQTGLLSGATQSWRMQFSVQDRKSNSEFVVSRMFSQFVKFVPAAPGATAVVKGLVLARNTVLAGIGGTTVGDDGTAIQIPAGACQEDLRVTIAVPPQELLDPRAGAPSTRVRGALSGSDVLYSRTISAYALSTGMNVASLKKQANITLPYPDADGDGIIDGTTVSERSLCLCYFDEAINGWVSLPSRVDAIHNTVSGSSERFGVYGIFAAPLFQGIADAICYPNPAYMSRGQVLNIGHIAASTGEVTIYIYTIAGELVRTLHEGSEITAAGGEKTGVWDGRNQSGAKVASGVYLCLIKGSGSKNIQKAAIIW